MSISIQEIIVLVAPYVLSAITFIGVVAKVIKSFADLKKQVVDMKQIEDVKSQMKTLLQENYELKKTLRETMTKIDHIERK